MKYHHKIWLLLCIHIVIFTFTISNQFNILYVVLSYALALVFQWIGNECGLHRLWSHNSYKTTEFKEKLLHIFATPLLYGTSLSYSCVHRTHHMNSDTEKDSHVLTPWWHVVLYIPNQLHPLDQRLCMDLLRDPLHLFIHKHYFKINALLLTMFLVIFGVHITGWTLSSIVVYNFIIGGMINVLGHTKHISSKRVYETKENSLNSKLLQVVTMNQGLHNNHHYSPSSWTFAHNKHEVDIPGYIIKYLLKE